MTWKGKHPSIVLVEGNYPTGVIVPKKEMNEINKRIIRSEKLPSYDILDAETPTRQVASACRSPNYSSKSCKPKTGSDPKNSPRWLPMLKTAADIFQMDAALKTKQPSERNLRAEHYWVRSL